MRNGWPSTTTESTRSQGKQSWTPLRENKAQQAAHHLQSNIHTSLKNGSHISVGHTKSQKQWMRAMRPCVSYVGPNGESTSNRSRTARTVHCSRRSVSSVAVRHKWDLQREALQKAWRQILRMDISSYHKVLICISPIFVSLAIVSSLRVSMPAKQNKSLWFGSEYHPCTRVDRFQLPKYSAKDYCCKKHQNRTTSCFTVPHDIQCPHCLTPKRIYLKHMRHCDECAILLKQCSVCCQDL